MCDFKNVCYDNIVYLVLFIPSGKIYSNSSTLGPVRIQKELVMSGQLMVYYPSNDVCHQRKELFRHYEN